MKLNIDWKGIARNVDWKGLLRAVVKTAVPFFAGAVGGLVSGCSVMGTGMGFFFT